MPLRAQTPDFARGATSPAGTSCSVDLALLQEYVGTDPADLQRFVLLGLDSLTQALAPLPRALADHDLPTLQASAHRAKSTARHLGAESFGNDCQALETAAQQGRGEDALRLGQQVHAQLPLLQAALHQALQRHGPSKSAPTNP